MNNPSETIDLTRFDVREIPCREKHARIFQRWAELPVGGHFVLVNDHDPVPLYYQFAAQFPGAFTWDYLVASADEFAVKITRLAATNKPVGLRPPTVGGGCGHHHDARADDVLNVRGLEPPEPMLRILAALENLAPGGELSALTDRRPVHLLAELDTRGIVHTSVEQANGSWLNTFRKPA